MSATNIFDSVISSKELATWDMNKCSSALKQMDRQLFTMAMSTGINRLEKPHLKSNCKRNIAKIKSHISRLMDAQEGQ